MSRLKDEFLDRVERFAHRVADVADAIEGQRRSRRCVDQLYGCGTSVGANAFETAEAMSRPDFCRGVSVVLKELAELRFWLRFVVKRGWIRAARLEALDREANELRKIIGSMLSKSRRAPK